MYQLLNGHVKSNKAYWCWWPNLSMGTYITRRALKWQETNIQLYFQICNIQYCTNTSLVHVSDDVYHDMPTYRVLTQFTISESNSVTNSLPLESFLAFDSCCSSVASWSKLSRHTWWTSDAWFTLWKHGWQYPALALIITYNFHQFCVSTSLTLSPASPCCPLSPGAPLYPCEKGQKVDSHITNNQHILWVSEDCINILILI